MSSPQVPAGGGLYNRPSTVSRNCLSCSRAIKPARLRAVPSATFCVECQEALGDVPLIRRFDEYVGEEQISTYFVDNPQIEAELRRINGEGAIPIDLMELCVGDDSFALRPPKAILGTDGLPSVFESEFDERVEEEVFNYAKAA